MNPEQEYAAQLAKTGSLCWYATPKTPIAKIGYMWSVAQLETSGGLNVFTRTQSAKPLEGFTGGVTVVALDANSATGKIIWHPEPPADTTRSYGVDGFDIPGKQSDRFEPWEVGTIPASVVKDVRALRVINFHNPKNRIVPVLDVLGKAVADAWSAFETWAKNYGENFSGDCNCTSGDGGDDNPDDGGNGYFPTDGS